MTVDEIRKFSKAEPFRPFAIHLMDGRRIQVPRHDYIMAPSGADMIVVCMPDDTFDFIDVARVTDLKLVARRSHGSRNRKKKRP